jgi:YgiT-type zinc finger domain-containing protein
MGQYASHCAFCMAPGLEPTTITMEREIGSVRITVEGVPATHCLSCGETGVSGKVAFPIDEAMTSIFVAAGAMIPETPEELAALREENRALARAVGQEDTFLDDPSEIPASQPSGAGTTV